MAAGLGQAAHAQYPLVPLANPIADEARAAITQHEAAAAIYGSTPRVLETRAWRLTNDGLIKPVWAEADATRGLQYLKLHPTKAANLLGGQSKTQSVPAGDGKMQASGSTAPITPIDDEPAQVANEYQPTSVQQDSLGMVHCRYQQVRNNVEIFGGEMITEGTETEVTDAYGSSFNEANISTTPAVSGADAIAYAQASRAYLGSFDTPPTAQLVILPSPIRNNGVAGAALLCYKVNLRIDNDDLLEDMDYFVNAQSGAVEWTQSKISGSNPITMGINTQYYGRQYVTAEHINGINRLIDPTRGNMEGADLQSTDNSWYIIYTNQNNYTFGDGTPSSGATVVGTGFWAAQMAHTYFKNVHGRNGWNNNNKTVGVRSR